MKEINPRPSLRGRLNNNLKLKKMKKAAFYLMPFLLAAALTILKLTGELSLPWYIVLFPIWGPISLIFWIVFLGWIFGNEEK